MKRLFLLRTPLDAPPPYKKVAPAASVAPNGRGERYTVVLVLGEPPSWAVPFNEAEVNGLTTATRADEHRIPPVEAFSYYVQVSYPRALRHFGRVHRSERRWNDRFSLEMVPRTAEEPYELVRPLNSPFPHNTHELC